ncbi:MAG: ABC transporter substrate-binding protein [Alphaproteobacteria bacterium]|nr:ABC transporter substrate-binding protein [Alphaproteobacteria bacterium]
MTRLYAKTAAFLKFFCVAVLAASLSGCAGGGYGPTTGWWSMPANNAVVTKDPHSLPDIAWQTPGQRRELTLQNNAYQSQIAQQQAQVQQQQQARPQQPQPYPRNPDRPGLQMMTAPQAPVQQTPQKVTVALLVPLTGKSANLGQAMLKSSQMALFDVGSANFELLPEDTQSTPDGAAAAARDAIAHGADLILGPIFADDVKAVKPLAMGANIPVIAYTTDWTLAGDGTYVMGFLPFAQVARVAQFARSRGYDRLAVFAPKTEYCDVAISTLQRAGVNLVRTERYSPEMTDLTQETGNFVDSSVVGGTDDEPQFNFNALLLPLGGESLRTLVSLMDLHHLNGQTVRYLGTGLWDDAALTKNPNLFGSWFAAPDPKLRRDFERRYQNNYGEPPPRLSTLAYDSTALAAVLSRSSDGASPYSRENLTNPRGFAGIDGLFRFRDDGLAERGLAVLEIESDKMLVVDPAPTAFVPSGS